MKYSTIIPICTNQSLASHLLKIDEFLKEYWGSAQFFIYTKESGIIAEPNFSDLFFDGSFRTLQFFAFKSPDEYEYLCRENHVITHDKKSEVFCFTIDAVKIEVCFYNCFETDERFRQFDKIISDLKQVLSNDLPLVRTRASTNGRVMSVMYKYRRNEGKTGFSFDPVDDEDAYYNNDNPSLFIYSSDFEYIKPFILSIFPRRLKG